MQHGSSITIMKKKNDYKFAIYKKKLITSVQFTKKKKCLQVCNLQF